MIFVMVSHSSRTSGKTSNRFTHGIFSRTTRELWLRSVEDVAVELIGEEPRTHNTLRAARDLAHTIFLLRTIRAKKIRVLSAALPHHSIWSTAPDTDALARGNEPQGQSIEETLERVRGKSRELTRLDTYERKALSRFRNKVNSFDYVIIETRRLARAEARREARKKKD